MPTVCSIHYHDSSCAKERIAMLGLDYLIRILWSETLIVLQLLLSFKMLV